MENECSESLLFHPSDKEAAFQSTDSCIIILSPGKVAKVEDAVVYLKNTFLKIVDDHLENFTKDKPESQVLNIFSNAYIKEEPIDIDSTELLKKEVESDNETNTFDNFPSERTIDNHILWPKTTNYVDAVILKCETD